MIGTAELDSFVAALDAAKAVHRAKNFPSLEAVTYSYTVGKKYARITEGRRGGVFCFVDLTNGDILKAAGYTAPAKGARGNISNGAAEVTPYGATYLNTDYATYRDMGIA